MSRLNLEQWYSWDKKYGENSDSMLEALLCPEKQEPEKECLLRAKLSAMGMDYIDAIRAVHDYRDLKIALDELQKRTRPHIAFRKLAVGWNVVNDIPEKFKPRLTEDALRVATATLKNGRNFFNSAPGRWRR